MSRRRALSAGILLVIAAALLAAAPLVASAAPRATGMPGVSAGSALTLSEFRDRGVGAARALSSLAPTEPAQSISGTLTLPGPYADDAEIWAVALVEEPGYGWYVVAGSTVETDGSYSIGLWEPGTYRVAFADWMGVYALLCWPATSTPEAATDVVVGDGEHMTGIDATLVPNPVVVIEGHVGFEGAPPSPAASVDAYLWNPEWGEWSWIQFAPVLEDGTYRLHLPETSIYRVGCWDSSGVFREVFYHDAEAIDLADNVAVLTTGTPVTGIDQTMTAIPSERFEGADRYQTAVSITAQQYPEGHVGAIVLTTGENWPDALVAGPYAAMSWSSLLLTRPEALPECVVDELLRLMPYEVVIIGGYDAVSLDVEIALRTVCRVPVVRRIMGHDRYETAALVAEELTSQWYIGSEDGMVETATIVSGEAFPDAMCAAPVATSLMSPILLTRTGSVPAATADYLDRHAVSQSLVVGGPAAISDAVASQLPAPVRVGGADRYGTAATLAGWAIDRELLNPAIYGLASGGSFADAVCAGAYLSSDYRPLLLTDPIELSGPTGAHLVDRSPAIARLELFGGPAALSDDAYEQAMEAAGLL